jgi:RNA recognition motif-containing protein
MSSIGRVTRSDIIPRRDGKSSGGGIVEYAEAADAARARKELHDSELGGRPIIVREDREGGRSAPSVISDRTSASSRPISTTGGNCRVYVGNLAWDVAWQGETRRTAESGILMDARIADPAVTWIVL